MSPESNVMFVDRPSKHDLEYAIKHNKVIVVRVSVGANVTDEQMKKRCQSIREEINITDPRVFYFADAGNDRTAFKATIRETFDTEPDEDEVADLPGT